MAMVSCTVSEMLSPFNSGVNFGSCLKSHDLSTSSYAAAFSIEDHRSSETESSSCDDTIEGDTSFIPDELKGFHRSYSSSSISSCLSDCSVQSNDTFITAISGIGTHPDKDREELQRIFNTFDKNLDGRISHGELLRTMSQLGFDLSETEIASLMSSVDNNGDGFLDLEEFVAFFGAVQYEEGEEGRQQEEEGAEDSDLVEAFRVFDKNSDGYICVGELQAVLSNLQVYEGRDVMDYERMIRAVDADGDGRVNFCEFKAMMTSS